MPSQSQASHQEANSEDEYGGSTDEEDDEEEGRVDQAAGQATVTSAFLGKEGHMWLSRAPECDHFGRTCDKKSVECDETFSLITPVRLTLSRSVCVERYFVSPPAFCEDVPLLCL